MSSPPEAEIDIYKIRLNEGITRQIFVSKIQPFMRVYKVDEEFVDQIERGLYKASEDRKQDIFQATRKAFPSYFDDTEKKFLVKVGNFSKFKKVKKYGVLAFVVLSGLGFFLIKMVGSNWVLLGQAEAALAVSSAIAAIVALWPRR